MNKTRILLLLTTCLLFAFGVSAREARVVRDVLDTSRSSWVESAVFAAEAGATHGDLTIVLNGETTTYLDVPVDIWLEFKEAESLGGYYGENIRNRYERYKGEPLAARHDSILRPAVRAEVQCAFNEECEPLLLRHIETASERILVAAYAFTRTRIGSALVAAHVRGVEVEVKVDAGQSEYPSADRLMKYLVRNGIPVTRISMKGKYSAMHNKFMVIDDRYVLAGSYNFTTTAGAANWENLLFVDSSEIAARYKAAWQAIVSE